MQRIRSKVTSCFDRGICEAYVENNYTNTERSYWLPNCLRVFKELCNYERLPTVVNTYFEFIDEDMPHPVCFDDQGTNIICIYRKQISMH